MGVYKQLQWIGIAGR